jgi:hypothetical protein
MDLTKQLFDYFAHHHSSFRVKPFYHSHPEYEVYYFHGGRGTLLIGEAFIDLVPGDLFILNGIKPHGLIMQEPCVRTMFRIDEAFVQPLLQQQVSIDLFRPFRELGNCHFRLTGAIRRKWNKY